MVSCCRQLPGRGQNDSTGRDFAAIQCELSTVASVSIVSVGGCHSQPFVLVVTRRPFPFQCASRERAFYYDWSSSEMCLPVATVMLFSRTRQSLRAEATRIPPYPY